MISCFAWYCAVQVNQELLRNITTMISTDYIYVPDFDMLVNTSKDIVKNGTIMNPIAPPANTPDPEIGMNCSLVILVIIFSKV